MTTTAPSAPPHTAPKVNLRPFQETDFPRMAEIRDALYPDYRISLDELRHWDATWEPDKYFKLRLAAEDAAGQVVGFGQTSHMPHQFHADKYEVSVHVHPTHQRRGYGTALFNRLIETIKQRGASVVRSEAKESLPESVAWLGRRGFN